MKDIGPVLVALIVGVIIGVLVADRFHKPIRATIADVESALSRARDSLNVLPAVEVRIDSVFLPGDSVVRVIRERQVDTVQVGGEVVFQTVTDTVFVTKDDGFAWTFADTTAVFALSGLCNANLADPSLSYATYNLTFDRAALCPKRYRLFAGAGIVAGNPFVAAGIRTGSWTVLPLIGLDDGGRGGDVLRIRYGAMAIKGVF